MRILKPKRLRHGDVIGICAPAGSLASPNLLDDGIRYIEQSGFRVELGKNLYRRNGYLAGTDAQRVADLHALFSNKHVRAIFAARGGYGSHRILPLLDFAMIKRNPKMLVGFSDITALQFALLAKIGMTSLSAPLVVEMPATFTPETEELFWRALTSAKPLGTISARRKQSFSGRPVAEGRLIGGNLSLLAALTGTEYCSAVRNNILFMEEIGERPYRIDRMIQQLKLSGVFKHSTGIILGDFSDCNPVKGKLSLTLSKIFSDSFNEFKYPILSGFRYGHIKHSLSIPIGILARLNRQKNSIEFLESVVS
jgi:muramoyltetrapeptide carboxypeptidase